MHEEIQVASDERLEAIHEETISIMLVKIYYKFKNSKMTKVKGWRLTENLKFGRKNEVTTTFVSFNIDNDSRISSRTCTVAVAVNAISGISNSRNSKLLALKVLRSTDNLLKHFKAYISYSW